MIKTFYSNVPQSMKHMSGAVFNSGSAAFSKPVSLYVLGLNPGGDPKTHADETVDSHSQKVFLKPSNWSGYRDDSWNDRPAGTNGIQPRILHALNSLGFDAHDVPTSNLIFVRTRTEKELNDFNLLAEQCWPFHEAVISNLEIKVVLCFGGKAGNWVRKKVGAITLVDQFIEINNRNWKSNAYVNPHGLHVIVASHPSRAAWTTASADPTPMIKRVIYGGWRQVEVDLETNK